MSIHNGIQRWFDDRGRPVKGRPLWVCQDSAVMLGQNDGSIVRYDPSSMVLQTVAFSPYNIARQAFAFSRLVARVFRMGPRAFVQLPNGTMVWVAGGALWRCEPDSGKPTPTHRFEAGSGPLFLALSSNNSIVLGDYVGDHTQRSSFIRRSEDEGRSWQTVYEFPASRIRHVHGTFWDPYAERICITTGDSDHEAGIWSLVGDMPQLIAGGRSLFRIVQPVFTMDAIFFGTDTPGEDCGIYRMSRCDGRVDLLQRTRGPVFFGTATNNNIVFSTVVEPGHPERAAALYVGSIDGTFKESLLLGKDVWHTQLFQYGQIHLPANNSPTTKLWFSPCATEFDHHLLSLDTKIERAYV